ncbi:Pentatricopeptide repeat-containing protein At2g31400, partial [Durusdinium trenchii]
MLPTVSFGGSALAAPEEVRRLGAVAAAAVPSASELHPAARVQQWKQKLRGWLWNRDLAPEEARDIYRALLRSGHAITLPEYSDIIAALGARSCWECSLDVWHLMGSRAVGRDLTALKTALRAVGNAGQWELAIALLDSASGTRLQPDMELFLHATSAVGEGRQWMLALPLLQEAQQRHITPDVSCYTAAIRALSLGNQPAQTLWLLHDVISIQLKPQERSYEAVLRSCGELSEWKRALEYLDYMFQDGLSSTAGAGSAAFCIVEAMQSCALCGQWSEVFRLFHEMSEQQVSRPVRSFSICLKACEQTHAWEEAVQVFGEFLDKGGLVEQDLVEPLLRTCIHAGQWSRAHSYLRELDELGFIPTFALSKFVAEHAEKAGQVTAVQGPLPRFVRFRSSADIAAVPWRLFVWLVQVIQHAYGMEPEPGCRNPGL